jgi:PKD repeat protein
VLFASDSSDPDGDAITHLWNFGDGVTSPNRNALHAFATSGPNTVTLTVTDPFGGSDTETQTVTVGPVEGPPNRLPRAGFTYAPRQPRVGDPIDLVSTSVDPEDQLRSQVWDLDGDGEFDDARGSEVLHTFTRAGTKTVRLRVEDSADQRAVEERQIRVDPAPAPPPGYMRPPPGYDFGGTILSNGMRVEYLNIRGPKAALVTVACRGRGCPVKQRRKRIKRRTVSFQSYERFLRAGVKLEIFIRKQGSIGAYRAYKIRAGKRPKRTDRCLEPNKPRPVRCR